MASIFDMFSKPAPAQATPPTTPVPPTVADNKTIPNGSNVPPADPAAPSSPLDKYNDLWNTEQTPDPNSQPFSFNADPAKLMDAAKGIDFTKILTPEVNARVLAGGADGQKAMMEAMNNMAQLSYAQSSLAASKIAETANRAAEERILARLPELMKKYSVQTNIRETNPLATDPAMAPMIEGLQLQFQRKFPNATAAEIGTHVESYLNMAADRITGNRPQPATKQSKREQDWSVYLES